MNKKRKLVDIAIYFSAGILFGVVAALLTATWEERLMNLAIFYGAIIVLGIIFNRSSR